MCESSAYSPYFNDSEAFPSAWLRRLFPEAHVDERSIRDVGADDVRGLRRVHLFAGIGGWEHALRLAGWPADREVWTGSCPCQPFSQAGKGLGTADERHLWPEMLRLITECRPQVVFGEQVCSVAVIGRQPKKGRRVPEDLSLQESLQGLGKARATQGEEEDAAFRSGSAFAGLADAYRQRLLRGFWPFVQPRWWEDVGQSLIRQDRPEEGLPLFEREGCLACPERGDGRLGRGEDAGDRAGDHGSPTARLKRALGEARAELDAAVGCQWFARVRVDLEEIGYRVGACDLPAAGVGAPHIRQRLYWVANAVQPGRPEGRPRTGSGQASRRCSIGGLEHADEPSHHGRTPGGEQQIRDERGAQAWSDYKIFNCTDGKARRVGSGIQPLAHGVPGRMGRLRAYGNAIVPPVAAVFVRSVLEVIQ